MDKPFCNSPLYGFLLRRGLFFLSTYCGQCGDKYKILMFSLMAEQMPHRHQIPGSIPEMSIYLTRLFAYILRKVVLF